MQKLGYDEKLTLRNLLGFHKAGKRAEVQAAYREANQNSYIIRAGFIAFEPVPGDTSRLYMFLTPAGVEVAEGLPEMTLGGYKV